MKIEDYNIFVGSSIGCVKGVNVSKGLTGLYIKNKNLINGKDKLSNKNEITCMEWNDDQLLIACNNYVQVLDTIKDEFILETCKTDEQIRGIFQENNILYSALKTGIVKLYNKNEPDNGWVDYFDINGTVDRLRRSNLNKNTLASGGKQKDLQLWDFPTKKLLFNAKNIKPDELQLAVPIWVSDIAFSQSSEIVSTCSRHGFIRTYDPRLPQRRPIFNTYKEETVFTCLTATSNEHQLYSGCTNGDIYLIDRRAKMPFLVKFKDGCGSIKSIACPPESKMVFSVSLDRHLRVHDFESRKLIAKKYLISKLNTITYKTPFVISEIEEPLVKNDENDDEILTIDDAAKKQKSDKKKMDRLFKNLETVKDSSCIIDKESSNTNDKVEDDNDGEPPIKKIKKAPKKKKESVTLAKKDDFEDNSHYEKEKSVHSKKINWKKC